MRESSAVRRYHLDLDDELYQNGSVIWAKFDGRPWWPCVVFKTWDDVRDWGLPISQTCELELHEVIFFFRCRGVVASRRVASVSSARLNNRCWAFFSRNTLRT